MPKMKRVGFTLIEMLVVLTIVAVLAAILTPVFATAKTAAFGAVSFSNLKGIYVALELYRGDQDKTTEYGSFKSMGLPPFESPNLTRIFKTYKPPLAPHMHPGSWSLGDQ